MGHRPNLNELIPLFESGENFQLTDAQYEKKTGAALPKDIYYIKKKSALSRECQRYGYELQVIEKTVCMMKKG